MWEFLKKIFSKRDGDVTVVVIDENQPEDSNSFSFSYSDIVKTALVVVTISILLTTMIFFITPLGTLYQHQQDESLRQDVLMIQEKIFSLQDSLDVRDNQLNELKQILIQTPDTLFQTRYRQEDASALEQGGGRAVFASGDMLAYEMISRNEIIFSDNLKRAPQFPAPWPAEGNLTQPYSPQSRHYGIDIAARDQSEFNAIADGTVIHAGWTVQFGYVIYLQHGDGYVSVYKHGARLFKKEGDVVLQGDMIGAIGDAGTLSSGPHLHLEIWKNGVAQDPQMYLIK